LAYFHRYELLHDHFICNYYTSDICRIPRLDAAFDALPVAMRLYAQANEPLYEKGVMYKQLSAKVLHLLNVWLPAFDFALKGAERFYKPAHP
jgi:hypothetical protein